MKKTKSRSNHTSIIVDEERARVVIGNLYESYVHNRGLFRYVGRETDAVQRRFIPKGMKPGSEAHCCWLFFATMTDRREESERVYESHTRLAISCPKLYTDAVIRMNPQSIAERLSAEKVGSPGQSARYWPRCAATLFDYFSGDPLALYQMEGGLINDVLRFKPSREGDRLPGFGPKILSLLALYYEELGLMRMPEDAFPVDVHVQRFVISTGIVRTTGTALNEEIEKVVRPLLCRICREEGISALELSHAIWFLGNRCCRGCYRNRAAEQLCPSYSHCGGSISTLTYTRKGSWDFDAPRHRKGGERTMMLPSDMPLFLMLEA